MDYNNAEDVVKQPFQLSLNKLVFGIRSAIVVVLLFISSMANAASCLKLADMIDYIQEKDMKALIISLVFFAGLLFVSAVCNIVAWRMIFSLLYYKTITLKNTIFKSDISDTKAAETRMADYNTNIDLVYDSIYLVRWNILNLVLTVICTIAAIVSIDPIILPVAILSSLLPFAVPFIGKKKREKVSVNFSQQVNEYQNYVIDRMRGKRVFQRYQVTTAVSLDHIERSSLSEKSRKEYREVKNFTQIFNSTVGSAAFLPVIGVGGYLAFLGRIGTGSVIAVINLMNYLVDPVVAIVQLINAMQQAKPIEKKLLKDRCDQKEASGSLELIHYHLRLQDISFSYPESTRSVIDNLNFEFEENKKYLITGESGAGKSTLAKLLIKDITVNSGEIFLENEPYRMIDRNQLLNVVRYVEQTPYIFEGTLFDNIAFYRDNITEEDVNNVIRRFGLENIPTDKVLSEETLSGGEKQRISLARSVLGNTPIMIFDEPTAALDAGMTYAVMNELVHIPSMIIVISHENSHKVLELFDAVLPLDERRGRNDYEKQNF